MSNKKYQLVIFDWDGTLIDSVARIVLCLEKTIKQLNLAPRNKQQLRNIIGLGLNQAIAAIYPEMTEQKNQTFAQCYREIFVTTESSQLFPGVFNMLDQLKASGTLVAIATGKGKKGLKHALKEVELDHFFHVTRCADETASKPNPQMLEEILNEFGLYADDAIMIGDSEYDLKMAENLQMDCIGVTYGVHGYEKLSTNKHIALLDDVKSLNNYLIAHTQSFITI